MYKCFKHHIICSKLSNMHFDDHADQPDNGPGEGCWWERLLVSNLHWERLLPFLFKPDSTIHQISILAKSEMKPLTLIFEGSRQLDLWFWRQLPSGRPSSDCQPCLSAKQPVVERENGNNNKNNKGHNNISTYIWYLSEDDPKKGMQILSHYYDTPIKQCTVPERNYHHMRLQSNHENIIMNHISESGLRSTPWKRSDKLLLIPWGFSVTRFDYTGA